MRKGGRQNFYEHIKALGTRAPSGRAAVNLNRKGRFERERSRIYEAALRKCNARVAKARLGSLSFNRGARGPAEGGGREVAPTQRLSAQRVSLATTDGTLDVLSEFDSLRIHLVQRAAGRHFQSAGKSWTWLLLKSVQSKMKQCCPQEKKQKTTFSYLTVDCFDVKLVSCSGCSQRTGSPRCLTDDGCWD